MSLTDSEKEVFIFKLLGAGEGFSNPFSDSFSTLKTTLESAKTYIESLKVTKTVEGVETTEGSKGFTVSDIDTISAAITSYISDIDLMVNHTNRLSGLTFSQSSQSNKPDIQAIMSVMASRRAIYEKTGRSDIALEKMKEVIGSIFNIDETEINSNISYFKSLENRIDDENIDVDPQAITVRLSTRQDYPALISDDEAAFRKALVEIRNDSYAQTLSGFFFSENNVFLDKVLEEPVIGVLNGEEPGDIGEEISLPADSGGEDEEEPEPPPPEPNYIESESENITGSNEIENIVTISRADYDALETKNSTTLYVIVG